MANTGPWKCNYRGALKPLEMNLLVAAGSGQTIELGEICYNNAGTFTPITAASDYTGDLVVCAREHKATDAAGYIPFYIPREDDVWEFELTTAAAAVRGAAHGWGGSSITLAPSAGNDFCHVFDTAGYPRVQGHSDVGDVADRGVAVGSVKMVLVTIMRADSYLATLCPLA